MARLCHTLLHPPSGHSLSLSLSLSFSLSLADLALTRLVSGVFSLSLADTIHPEGTPWILLGLGPGRVGSHSLLQGIFLTQGLNLSLLDCRQILYCMNN